MTPSDRGLLRTPTRTTAFVQSGAVLVWNTSVDLTQIPAKIETAMPPKDVARSIEAAFQQQVGDEYRTALTLFLGISLRARLHASSAAALAVADVLPARAEISELSLELTYSYRPQGNVRGVRVTSSGADGAAPYFHVGAPDVAGLQHGQGALTRTYGSETTIDITVPSQLGAAKFAG